MKPEIEFLQEIKKEFATAEYGEGMSVNLDGIERTINDRINQIKELSKLNACTQIKWISINTPPEDNKDVLLWKGSHLSRQETMLRAFYEPSTKIWYDNEGELITEDVLKVYTYWLDIKPPAKKQ